jgi:hypothetical protein
VFDGKQDEIERFLQLGRRRDVWVDLSVAVRTDDLESALPQLLRTVVAHEERYVTARLGETSPKVTSDGAGSND